MKRSAAKRFIGVTSPVYLSSHSLLLANGGRSVQILYLSILHCEKEFFKCISLTEGDFSPFIRKIHFNLEMIFTGLGNCTSILFSNTELEYMFSVTSLFWAALVMQAFNIAGLCCHPLHVLTFLCHIITAQCGHAEHIWSDFNQMLKCFGFWAGRGEYGHVKSGATVCLKIRLWSELVMLSFVTSENVIQMRFVFDECQRLRQRKQTRFSNCIWLCFDTLANPPAFWDDAFPKHCSVAVLLAPWRLSPAGRILT